MNVRPPPLDTSEYADRTTLGRPPARAKREQIRALAREAALREIERRHILRTRFDPIAFFERERKREIARLKRKDWASRISGVPATTWRATRSICENVGSASIATINLCRSQRFRPLALCSLILIAAVFAQVANPKTTEAVARYIVRVIHPGGEETAGFYKRRLDCASLTPVIAGDGSSVGWHRKPDCRPEETPELRVTPLSDDEILHILPFYEIVEGQAGIGRETLLGVNLLGLPRLRIAVMNASKNTHSSSDIKFRAKITSRAKGILNQILALLGIPFVNRT
ncbi:MAG: hypothetical protein ACU0B1_00300 [Thermohalobaculum sp.]